MRLIDGLWGGQLNSLHFDPVSQTCVFHVTTTTHGSTVVFAIRCDSVCELRFVSTIAQPWDYAEVTEADLSTDEETGLMTMELMLWSEEASLVITAASIQVTPGT